MGRSDNKYNDDINKVWPVLQRSAKFLDEFLTELHTFDPHQKLSQESIDFMASVCGRYVGEVQSFLYEFADKRKGTHCRKIMEKKASTLAGAKPNEVVLPESQGDKRPGLKA